MKTKTCTTEDIAELAQLNRQLHEDEGADPMDLEDISDRFARWLANEYTAVLFIQSNETVAYVLFRSTDRDTEGLENGIFIRQFFVVREHRRKGIGRHAIDILRQSIWPEGCGILLDTEYENHRAHKFWESVGFARHHISFIQWPGQKGKSV